jgi:hypothetical protein
MKITNPFKSQYFLAFIGLIFLISYIWHRYIRERLPRDIPFQLTIFGFLFLSFICITYAASILISLSNKKQQLDDIFKLITDYLLKSVDYLTELLLDNKITALLFEKYFIKFSHTIKKIGYDKVFIILELIPRSILVIVFCIDVFYFGCIKYFYNIILLSIFVLCSKFVLYLLKHVMNKNIQTIDRRSELLCINYVDVGKLRYIPIVAATQFVHEQVRRELANLNDLKYEPSFNIDYVTGLRKRFNILKTIKFNTEKFSGEIRAILNLTVSRYKIIFLFEQKRSKLNPVNLIIQGLYLICWLYILFVSISILPIDTLTP